MSDPVSAAYDRWAKRYDLDENKTRDLDAVILRRALPSVDGRDVLELGCGTGKNTQWLAERARNVIALDASRGMLRIARERVRASNVQFVEHDIRGVLPLEPASVSFVIIDLVLEHVADVVPVFVEASRVLRAGGVLFVCELHPARQMLGARAHFVDAASGEVVDVPVVRHTVAEFLEAGIAAGLTLDRADEWWDEGAERASSGPRLWSVLFRKR